MDRVLEQRLGKLARASSHLVQGGLKGVEKECLRITPDGRISGRPHPSALGSALTNRYITTDFSEALLEFVTPPVQESWEALQFLCEIHQFVASAIDDEMLWATSMPCAVASEDSVPIARYGNSNVGRMKHVYRQGLSHRYGRVMQAIAGVHFNYSVPDGFWPAYQDLESDGGALQSFVDASYFGLLRNFHRLGWISLYLFGASPAVCKSFLGGRSTDLPELDAYTRFAPYATTLRMSDLGYQNENQASIGISVNGVEEYIAGLSHAVNTPFPPYERIGVRVDGEYRQLNSNILQIENEYYSLIRPKRVARSGERPTQALRRGGVQYIEVRALDVSAFDPVGINQNEMRFLEAFLLLCLLADSPIMGAAELEEIQLNQVAVARAGRDPKLELMKAGKPCLLRHWASEILEAMTPVCELLDGGDPVRPYANALTQQKECVQDDGRTPSARILAEMRETGEPFFAFALRMSGTHKEYLQDLPIHDDRLQRMFAEEAARSLERQAEIEAADEVSFEEYLRQYFSG